MEMGVRFYEEGTGRFISLDVLGAISRNLPQNIVLFEEYVYAKNSPLKFVDPSGLSANSDCHARCALIATAGDLLVGGACVGGGALLGASAGGIGAAAGAGVGLAAWAIAHVYIEKEAEKCNKGCDKQYPSK